MGFDPAAPVSAQPAMTPSTASEATPAHVAPTRAINEDIVTTSPEGDSSARIDGSARAHPTSVPRAECQDRRAPGFGCAQTQPAITGITTTTTALLCKVSTIPEPARNPTLQMLAKKTANNEGGVSVVRHGELMSHCAAATTCA